MRQAFLVLALACAGCASSGVVPIGGEVFMIARSGAAPGATADTVLVGLYREAGEFCDAKGKRVETVSSGGKDWVPFVRTASGRLEFRCVTP
jgi:hypothetical protein